MLPNRFRHDVKDAGAVDAVELAELRRGELRRVGVNDFCSMTKRGQCLARSCA
jgi:hypothetical protein